MSEYTPLERLHMLSEDGIGTGYGTVNATLVIELVAAAVADHAVELRKAKAEVLRDLARDTEALETAASDGMNERSGPYPWNAAKGVRDMLFARADEMEGEQG